MYVINVQKGEVINLIIFDNPDDTLFFIPICVLHIENENYRTSIYFSRDLGHGLDPIARLSFSVFITRRDSHVVRLTPRQFVTLRESLMAIVLLRLCLQSGRAIVSILENVLTINTMVALFEKLILNKVKVFKNN